MGASLGFRLSLIKNTACIYYLLARRPRRPRRRPSGRHPILLIHGGFVVSFAAITARKMMHPSSHR